MKPSFQLLYTQFIHYFLTVSVHVVLSIMTALGLFPSCRHGHRDLMYCPLDVICEKKEVHTMSFTHPFSWMMMIHLFYYMCVQMCNNLIYVMY